MKAIYLNTSVISVFHCISVMWRRISIISKKIQLKLRYIDKQYLSVGFQMLVITMWTKSTTATDNMQRRVHSLSLDAAHTVS